MFLFRRFGPKCSGCGEGISPQDLVRKARDKVFHLKCFTCFVCRKQLVTGEELYVVDDTKFVCKEDYNNRLNDSMYEDEDDLEDDNGLDGEDSLLDHPKLGEANNNNLLGLSPRLSPSSALATTRTKPAPPIPNHPRLNAGAISATITVSTTAILPT